MKKLLELLSISHLEDIQGFRIITERRKISLLKLLQIKYEINLTTPTNAFKGTYIFINFRHVITIVQSAQRKSLQIIQHFVLSQLLCPFWQSVLNTESLEINNTASILLVGVLR